MAGGGSDFIVIRGTGHLSEEGWVERRRGARRVSAAGAGRGWISHQDSNVQKVHEMPIYMNALFGHFN